jgi:hypothetical protein
MQLIENRCLGQRTDDETSGGAEFSGVEKRGPTLSEVNVSFLILSYSIFESKIKREKLFESALSGRKGKSLAQKVRSETPKFLDRTSRLGRLALIHTRPSCIPANNAPCSRRTGLASIRHVAR